MSWSAETEEHGTVLHTWAVPGMTPGAAEPIAVRAGEATVIVGANGAGKSALGVWLDLTSYGVPSKRLIAHRRLWFQSPGPDISSAQRESLGVNMQSWGQQQESRYLDHADSARASVVLFDVLAALNAQNGHIADLVMAGVDRAAIDQASGPRVLDRLNSILGDAGLPVRLTLTPRQTFDAVNVQRAAQYPIHQMSDGEKSAILLASEVMTAPAGSIQIIDEPERHLHRSISAGLVEAVIADRPDCHFVVLTHDLELAASLDRGRNQTYVLTDCVWAGPSATGWSLLPVGSSSDIPETARRAILGGRRDILFIEGNANSLDTKLYRILFPNWTLEAAGGADQVVRGVAGLEASATHHWVRARGVVDGDGRSEEERASLLSRGVLSLPVSEVESLYYVDVVRLAVATSQAASLDRSGVELNAAAQSRALDALRAEGVFDRLARKLALAEVRRKVVEHLPTESELTEQPIEVAIPSPVVEVRARIQALSDANDLDGLVRLLPIRDTPLRGRVANALGFQNTADYEAAVRVRLRLDAALSNALRTIVGPVPAGAGAEGAS